MNGPIPPIPPISGTVSPPQTSSSSNWPEIAIVVGVVALNLLICGLEDWDYRVACTLVGLEVFGYFLARGAIYLMDRPEQQRATVKPASIPPEEQSNMFDGEQEDFLSGYRAPEVSDTKLAAQAKRLLGMGDSQTELINPVEEQTPSEDLQRTMRAIVVLRDEGFI